MEAKLIKINGEYLLNPSIVGTKLSLKNCQAIERGYDLDELAKADADLRYNQPGEEDLWLTRVTGIEYGFNLALKILGDKKFSKEDAKRLFELGIEHGHRDGYVGLNYTNKCIQSLQQNEWEVSCNPDVKDADGCLILKRK